MDQTLVATHLVLEKPAPIRSQDLVWFYAAAPNTVSTTQTTRSITMADTNKKGSQKRKLDEVETRDLKSRKVSFAPTKYTLIPNSPFYEQRGKDELKNLWYSREELMESCNEAKDIVKLIHLVGGKLEEIDHSRHCVVGLEKYHGKKERERYRKLLIRSVLIRQEMNRGLGLGTNENDCLSEISQLMSSSFKDFALWQAAMHEFHAYGKSQPSHSLILQQKQRMEQKDKHTTPTTAITTTPRPPVLVAVECGKEQRMMIDTATFPIVRTSNPNSSPHNMDRDQNSVVCKTQPLHHPSQHQNQQHPQEHLQNMLKVMEGYVDRKRLRSEVGHLMSTAQVIGTTQILGSHSIPIPYPESGLQNRATR